MVQSYAALHRERVAGGQVLPPAHHGTPDTAFHRLRQLMAVALESDQYRLSSIRSLAWRAQVKREMLETYTDYLQACLARSYRKDNVFVTLCIWALDAGDYRLFLTLGRHALKHQMFPPKGFKRSLVEIFLEQLADAKFAPEQAETWGHCLQELYHLTAGLDVGDTVSAKFNKALGHYLERDHPEQALTHYHRAALYGARVQGKIAQLEKKRHAITLQ